MTIPFLWDGFAGAGFAARRLRLRRWRADKLFRRMPLVKKSNNKVENEAMGVSRP